MKLTEEESGGIKAGLGIGYTRISGTLKVRLTDSNLTTRHLQYGYTKTSGCS